MQERTGLTPMLHIATIGISVGTAVGAFGHEMVVALAYVATAGATLLGWTWVFFSRQYGHFYWPASTWW